MDHEQYRKLFPQYPPLPDDKIVYGPHPNHGNWYKPQWNASQMLADQNKRHEPLPRWTSAKMIGDLGAYGRYQEAKKLAGTDEKKLKKNPTSLHAFPHITPTDLKKLRSDAMRAIETSMLVNSEPMFGLVGLGAIAGTVYGLVTKDPYQGIAVFDSFGVTAIGTGVVAEIARRRRQAQLYEDEAVASK